MTQYVGRISLKHFAGNADFTAEDKGREAALVFAAEVDLQAPCFVYEEGSINEEPHLHFYFECTKSLSSIQRALKKAFELPPKVRML